MCPHSTPAQPYTLTENRRSNDNRADVPSWPVEVNEILSLPAGSSVE
jgi:hypothetical protein